MAQPLDVSFFGPLKKHWARVCHEYTVDDPGRAVTKFQFSSLFNKAWFLAIQPSTIVFGFRKVGVYPFDPAAIKPYETSKAPTVKTPSESLPNESEESRIESGHGPSATAPLSEEQIILFERRYENGYAIYEDRLYVEWL